MLGDEAIRRSDPRNCWRPNQATTISDWRHPSLGGASNMKYLLSAQGTCETIQRITEWRRAMDTSEAIVEGQRLLHGAASVHSVIRSIVSRVAWALSKYFINMIPLFSIPNHNPSDRPTGETKNDIIISKR